MFRGGANGKVSLTKKPAGSDRPPLHSGDSPCFAFVRRCGVYLLPLTSPTTCVLLTLRVPHGAAQSCWESYTLRRASAVAPTTTKAEKLR